MDFFVSCGEISGDKHLSYLVEKIKEKHPDIKFSGIAGSYNKRDVKILENIDNMSVMGFSGLIGKYNYFKSIMEKSVAYILENNIKNIILVDFGGFNLRLLKKLKKENKEINIYYYIPPKLWAWGKNRLKTLRLSKHIMVIFPFEVDFYKNLNTDVVYFGNPLVDKYKNIVKNSNSEKIMLLPGSRKQEILSSKNIYNSLIERNKNRLFVLKLAEKQHLEYFSNFKYDNLEIEINEKISETAVNIKLAIAVSGTITLELALMKIPTIVVYKTTKLNEFIGRNFMDIKYVSLPNIILKKEVFPELLQDDFNVLKIESEIKRIENSFNDMKGDFEKIRKLLGKENIIEKYAEYVVQNKID